MVNWHSLEKGGDLVDLSDKPNRSSAIKTDLMLLLDFTIQT